MRTSGLSDAVASGLTRRRGGVHVRKVEEEDDEEAVAEAAGPVLGRPLRFTLLPGFAWLPLLVGERRWRRH